MHGLRIVCFAFLALRCYDTLGKSCVLVSYQAAQVVRVYSDGDESAVESFMQSVLEGQEDILNDATADLSQSQVEAIFSAWAVDTGAVIVDDFRR